MCQVSAQSIFSPYLDTANVDACAGERIKQRREEEERTRTNVQRASSAYEAPTPEQLSGIDNVSGVPWGGISIKHVVESGRAKEDYDAFDASREESAENRAQGDNTTQ